MQSVNATFYLKNPQIFNIQAPSQVFTILEDDEDFWNFPSTNFLSRLMVSLTLSIKLTLTWIISLTDNTKCQSGRTKDKRPMDHYAHLSDIHLKRHGFFDLKQHDQQLLIFWYIRTGGIWNTLFTWVDAISHVKVFFNISIRPGVML